MADIVIIDYKLGNLFSVKNACEKIGMDAIISNDLSDLEKAKALILPGVGAFQEAMANLDDLGLINGIKAHVDKGLPFFGVCLGLQLLFSESDEFGKHKGLDFIEGTVEKIPTEINGNKVPVPQIGWNTIETPNFDKYTSSPLNGVQNEDFMYFVHSYYVNPKQDDVVLTKTNYGGLNYCSSVLKNNIFATQFHPEKSGEKGLEIYRKWATQYNLIR